MKISSYNEAKQAAFNGAVRGLAFQKWEVCRAQGNDKGCVLNQGKPGVHCAVGWLIPWKNQENFANSFETSVEDLFPLKILAAPLQEFIDNNPKSRSVFKSFLKRLQETHDCSDDSAELKRSFIEFKKENRDLTWPSDVSMI
jgi:hypothetical protein